MKRWNIKELSIHSYTFALLTIIFIFFHFSSIIVYASEYDDFDYTINESETEVTITKYNGNEENVQIPSMIEGIPVTKIGKKAFYENETISSIDIPYGIIGIGESAFEDCHNLTSVTIPNSVTNIGHAAFWCSGLKSINLPNNIKKMGGYAFAATQITTIKIPEGTTFIGDDEFCDCRLLENVLIPSTVTSIGQGAFQNCESLKQITLPSKLEKLDSFAFTGSAITSISIPNSVTQMKNAFKGNNTLTSVIIEEGATEICEYSFNECHTLNSIILPDSINKIGQYAFAYSELDNIQIPNSTEIIEESAFYNCPLNEIIIPDGVTYIGESSFYGCKFSNIDIPDSVTYIGKNAFSNNKQLSSFKYSSNVDTINAFGNCDALVNVIIPDNIIKIDEYAFNYCKSLTTIEIPDSVKIIGEKAFFSCESLDNIELPKDIEIIGENAFGGCKSLTKIELPNSLTTLGNYAFSDCDSLNNVFIPNTIINMGNSPFSGCDSLTNMEIADGVTFFWDYFCQYNYSLKNIKLPDSITKIGKYAFDGCSSLETIDLPSNLCELDEYAFNQCNSLENIIIPSKVESLGDHLFNDCTSLKSVKILGRLCNIYSYTFCKCTTLESVDIANGPYYIYEAAFYNCTSLNEVKIPISVKNFNRNAFYNCNNLKSIYFEGTEEVWNHMEAHPKLPEGVVVYYGTKQNDDIIIISKPTSEMTYLAMAGLAYCNLEVNENITIGESEQYEAYYKSICEMKEGNEFKNIPHTHSEMTYSVYAKDLLEYVKDWKIIKVRNNTKNTGFYAALLERGNERIIAVRGSEAAKLKQWSHTNNYDWIDNLIYGGSENVSLQMIDAMIFADEVINDSSDYTYKATGHSLGGGLAMFIGNYKGIEAYGFDGSPTTDVSYYRMACEMSENYKGIDKWKSIDYINENCPVGNIDKHVKNTISLTDRHDTLNPFDAHQRWSITDYDNGLRLSPTVEQHYFKDTNILRKDMTRLPVIPLESCYPSLLSTSYGRTLLTMVTTLSGLNRTFPAGTLTLGSSSGQIMYASLKINNCHTDVMYGGDGDDVIFGYHGDDILVGGDGNDTLDGGTGNDTYVYWKGQGVDTIIDISGNDTLILNGFDNDKITFDSDLMNIYVKASGTTIIKINKLRDKLIGTDSFVVMKKYKTRKDEKEDVELTKLQDWSHWNNVKNMTIACPTKVQIFDKNDNLVLELEEPLDAPIYTDYGQFYVYEEDGEVIKHVVVEDSYTVKVVATGNGEMNFDAYVETEGSIEYLSAHNISITEGEVFDVDLTEDCSLDNGNETIELEKTIDVKPTINVKEESISMKVGDKYQINASIDSSNNDKLYYESNDSKIVEISDDGTVTALSEGNTMICIYSETGISKNITISVTSKSSPTSKPTNAPTKKTTQEATKKPSTEPTTVPTGTVTPSAQPSTAPKTSPAPVVAKDKKTTFSIKNKATIKKSAKIKIKDKDKIKKITLNGKTIKIKKNKTSFTLKLKSYKKKLKKKGKWNTLKVTDNKGNVKIIKFKTK